MKEVLAIEDGTEDLRIPVICFLKGERVGTKKDIDQMEQRSSFY